MHHTAILRPPAPTFAAGITTAGLGRPDYEKALAQHRAYGEALQQCGLELILLDADDRYPDSCFVEDTAIVMEELAILCRPGAASRRGEVAAVAEVLAEFRPIATIKPPGTVDGGMSCGWATTSTSAGPNGPTRRGRGSWPVFCLMVDILPPRSR
ncbi:MAG: hypothetical protein KDD19_20710 [Phaeodactylibacter sp.]|nr:hypothetical protein [Phaeodactylibacter sp.]